ncbi:glycosyltransferase family 2 protein [Arthrobacter sp. TWP1-1]|uniref:glycosyltransferase family 2 protein n=1 Tax=Arthrobacter sp. TWP1-1 TaxID=2804568 RepID=UPI003CF179EB
MTSLNPPSTLTQHLPAVAVIMTAYNAESTIYKSLKSALLQDYAGPLKIIVVNDGSTDNTQGVIESLGSRLIEVYSTGRLGRVRALNFALDAAKGSEFIANLDSDDFMLPNRISKQVEALVADPSLGVVGSAYFEVHLSNSSDAASIFEVSPPTSDENMRRAMASGFPICHSCATYRRQVAVELGGFNSLLKARIDFDLWLRMAIAGYRVVNLSDTLGIHIKRTGTFFDKQYSTIRSARQMARLNYIAAGRLTLGIQGYFTATARLGYSLLRSQSVKRTPRFSKCIDPSSDQYRAISETAKAGMVKA